MAPKKHEPPPPPPEDVNPIGVFVSVTIPAATVVLDIPADAAQDPASQRKTHITLNLPGCHVPWASPPIAASEGNIYQYSIVKHFRRSGGQDGLLQLINGNIAVTIHDSATNAPLASATIDQMWGFAIGQNTWSADGFELTPVAEVPAGVPKVLSAQLSFVSLALQERQLPPGADAAALAAAPPPESELPPLLPYSYVTPEFAASGNMVELVVHDLSPLPQQLHTANELAGGKLSVAVGVRMPGGPCVVVHATLHGGQLVMPVLRREQLTAEACTALKYHLEDGLPMVLEVARYVTAEHFNDPAWEAYHTATPASGLFKVLMSAGATQGAAEGMALEAYGTVAAAQGISKSCLPPYTPPPSKSKPIEEAPPHGTCHWEKLGCRLSVSFRLARPVIPPWQPPPPPPRSLLEMIPPRDLTPKPPPATAADEFKAKVCTIARALAEEYKAVLPPGWEAAGGGGESSESRHKALVFELNRSGKYAQMRDSLKTAVVSLVREKYRKSGSMSPNEMALLYNDLYGTLLAAVHSALNDMIDAAAARPRNPLPDPVPDKQRLGQLLDLAGQAEALGDTNRAEALHQRRLLAKTDPQVWYEYGIFCLRRGARGRAEQAFREALSLSPTHRPALLALLGCSVAEGRATDGAYLEAAEAAAHRLMEVGGAEPMAQWAVMALVYKAFGDSKRTDLNSCEQEMSRLEQEALGELAANNPTLTAKPPTPVSPAAGGTPLGGPPAPSTPSAPPTASPRSSAAPSGHRNTNASGDGADSGSSAAAGTGYGGSFGGPVVGELQSRAFISLATTLLETLSLPSEALMALELAAAQRHWSAMAPDTRCAHSLTVCLAQQALAADPGAGPEARAVGEVLLAPGSALVGLMRGGGVPGVRARLVAAQLYRSWGQTELAIRFYQEYLDALRAAGRLSEVPLTVWLQLAGCYIARGQHRYAADVYLGGAAQKPGCAALWRGAGEALLVEGDLSGADMALSEANVLDPEDPTAWGWLAVGAVREGRQDDAEKALSFALRCGLEEPAVLLQLADEYGSLGQLRQQQRVLEELALRLMPESCGMRLRLARCLAAQHMGLEAAREVEAARQLAGTEDDEAAVAAVAEQLRSS